MSLHRELVTFTLDYFITPKGQSNAVNTINVDMRNYINSNSHNVVIVKLMEGQLHVKLLNMIASMSRRSGSFEREIL